MGDIIDADFKKKSWATRKVEQFEKGITEQQRLVELQDSTNDAKDLLDQALDGGYDNTKAIVVIPVGDEENSLAIGVMVGYDTDEEAIATLRRSADILEKQNAK